MAREEPTFSRFDLTIFAAIYKEQEKKKNLEIAGIATPVISSVSPIPNIYAHIM